MTKCGETTLSAVHEMENGKHRRSAAVARLEKERTEDYIK